MTRLRQARPRPAMIVAVLALVAALAGTAVASDPVANTAVTKKKTKQIAKRIANRAVADALPIGSGELATIDEHTEIISIPGNSHRSITASCDAGETIISGGWRWLYEGANNVEVRSDHREGNAWLASGRNDTATPKEFRVHAYCLTTGL
jgi:hypothetical protein